MGFFTVKANEENVRDYSGDSAFINKSGMYEITIKALIVDQTKNGSQVLNLWFTYKEKDQMIYQAIRMTNNDGSPNVRGHELLTKLGVVASGTSSGEFEIDDPVSMMLPVGKDGEEKECMVLDQFCNVPIHIHVRMEYSLYEGKIRENKLIHNFFRYEDKATASEIVNNSETKGSQYEKEEASITTKYKDDLTEEDVQNWIKERRSGKKEEEKKPSNGFGQKRTFGKKS